MYSFLRDFLKLLDFCFGVRWEVGGQGGNYWRVHMYFNQFCLSKLFGFDCTTLPVFSYVFQMGIINEGFSGCTIYL